MQAFRASPYRRTNLKYESGISKETGIEMKMDDIDKFGLMDLNGHLVDMKSITIDTPICEIARISADIGSFLERSGVCCGEEKGPEDGEYRGCADEYTCYLCSLCCKKTIKELAEKWRVDADKMLRVLKYRMIYY